MKQAKLKWHVITKYPAFYQLRTIIGSNWVPPPRGPCPPKEPLRYMMQYLNQYF